MESKKFKLAMIQMLVNGGDPDGNINHAVNLVEDAANRGAELALLPECLDIGWTHPCSAELADTIPEGRVCRALRKAAADYNIHICADGFAKDQVLSRSLCLMGAEVILSPCAWAVRADHDNTADPYGDFWRGHYIPVARDFTATIIGVSNVGAITGGPWEGRKCIGCSLAIGPDGKDIVQGPYGIDAEAILIIDMP
jgi:predicted amidohydrolase